MNIDLTPYTITRPEKLRWRFPVTDDVLSHIKSHSLKTFLKKVDQELEKNGVAIETKELSADDFHEWLTYYNQKMTESQYEVIANDEWYQQKITRNKKVYAISAYHQQRLVGTLVYTWTPELASIAFRANDKLDIFPGGRSSIGAVLDYFFLKKMVAEHMPAISAGVTRNAFGVINTLGNLDFKLRFGYEPSPTTKTEFDSSVPVNDEGIVLFLGQKENVFSFYALKPRGSQVTFEHARFASEKMPFVELEY